MVIQTYSCREENRGLLAIAFPQIPVLRAPFMPFVTQRRVIVFSEDPNFDKYPEKEVIQISRKSPRALDTKDGFLKFLATRGIRANKHQYGQLMELSSDFFWSEVKLATVLRKFPNIPSGRPNDRRSTVFDIFANLFVDFGETYKHYRASKLPYKVVIASLITMMRKARLVDRLNVRDGYRRLLKKNQQYQVIFGANLLDYIEESDMGEMDAVAFLAACSEHTRPPLPLLAFLDKDKYLDYCASTRNLEESRNTLARFKRDRQV